jgi:hypothetical protein
VALLPDCSLYHPRQPRATPLYRLVDARYGGVREQWEERFETRYGFWRPLADRAVAAFLDCGLLENGFARVRCGACTAEYLVAFSCKGRGLCPSCAAKRAAELAAFLREEVLEDVGHAQWVFSLPKMVRPYFLYHRPLLGRLCRAAYETVRELMAEAVADPRFQPGMIAVVQTFGDALTWNPHVHALVTRGGWDRDGVWTPLPYIDQTAAAELFRHKVFRFLAREGLLAPGRIELLLSWRHSGFSVHNTVTVPPDDGAGLERLARYLLRAPVSLERLAFDAEAGLASYRCRPGREPFTGETVGCDPSELLARVLIHIPEPRRHLVRYYGAYSSVVRARRRADSRPRARDGTQEPPSASPERRALRRLWVALIRRIYEVDPLVCPRCGEPMRIIAFITEPKVIRKILRHIETKAAGTRDPPPDAGTAAA